MAGHASRRAHVINILAVVLGATILLWPNSHATASPGENDLRVQRLADQPPAGEFVRGEILVRFSPTARAIDVRRFLSVQGLRDLEASERSGYHRIGVPGAASERQVIESLRRNPIVDVATLNYVFAELGCPGAPSTDDPDYCLQWHYSDGPGAIHVEAAWGAVLGNNTVSGENGDGVLVAVIDSGLQYQAFGGVPQAPEWAGQQWKVHIPPGVNVDTVNNDSIPNDDRGHGTHVTNTVTQNTHNGLLGAGVANGARVMPIKVIGADGSGTLHDLIDGVNIAADHGADVINMSLGFDPSLTADDLAPLGEAILDAHSQGVFIVAASGNNGGAIGYPAKYPEVVATGAVKYDGTITYYSSRGSEQELVAPGGQYCADGDIWCQLGIPISGYNDQNGDGWPDGILQETCYPDSLGVWTCDDWFFEGTSMASPHVAAVAALVIGRARELGVDLGPTDVRQILRETAREAGLPGPDSSYGYGIVDAGRAVEAVAGIVAGPQVTIDQAVGQIDPTNGSPINFTVSFSEAVVGFDEVDVILAGTAGATTVVVTGTGATYNVAVTGMSHDGTVVASIGAGAASAEDDGTPSVASSSTDNIVEFDATAPEVTINQAIGQADPTSGSPINFTVTFSEAVAGFDESDVKLDGTAGATTAEVTGTGPYNVAVSGMSGDGTVSAAIVEGAAADAAGNLTQASTSADGTVFYEIAAPSSGAETMVSYGMYGGRNSDKHLDTHVVVTDGASGLPVPGAEVTLTLYFDGSLVEGLRQTTASNGTLSFSITNAAAGCWETVVSSVDGVPPATASDPGFVKPTGEACSFVP